MRIALTLLAAAAAATTPLAWKKTTPTAELSLTLPAVVRHAPVLADRLYRGEIKGLERFSAEAADPKDGLRSEPAAFRKQGRWEMEVSYAPALETGRLLSLYRSAYTDTHGAHPNHEDGGIVFDKPTNRNLHPLDLLIPGADLKPLDRALCDAARAAKRERNEGPWNEKEDTNFSCPTWRGLFGETGKLLEGSAPPQIALAPGDMAGKAGGLTFIYSPYDIGAYVEGGYAVVLQQAVFRAALRPQYAAEFAGRAKPDKHLEQ